MKNCLVYARTATVDDESINKQISECRSYAENHGFRVLKSFIDSGVSGVTIKRKGLKELLNYCTKFHPGAVIILRLDRLARSISLYSKLFQKFKEQGIKCISVNEGDLDGLTGNIFASVAQFEYERREKIDE